MKYIIMCGGKYKHWKTPKHLLKINGEAVVERTIRLLKENGISDISISTNNPAFEYLGLPILKHKNSYEYNKGIITGYWVDAFYPTNEPTCYIFGDVVFSPEAIKTIVETETDDMEFFASKKPFAYNYIKTHEEPFALKVVNTKHLKEAIEKTKKLSDLNKFWRHPLMWELWTVIKNTPLQVRKDEYTADYFAINDYSCDIDKEEDIPKIEKLLKYEGGFKMVKLEALETFTLGKFNELKNIVRKRQDTYGKLYMGDVFECNKEIADYLLGDNKLKRAVVKVLEIIPEEIKKEETKVEFHKEPAKELKIEFKPKKPKKSLKNNKNII